MHLKTLTPERRVSESGYRYYSPTLGRWLSRDPLGETDGPNTYLFVANRPTDGLDAAGLAFTLSWTIADFGIGNCGNFNYVRKWQIAPQNQIASWFTWVMQGVRVELHAFRCNGGAFVDHSDVWYEMFMILDGLTIDSDRWGVKDFGLCTWGYGSIDGHAAFWNSSVVPFPLVPPWYRGPKNEIRLGAPWVIGAPDSNWADRRVDFRWNCCAGPSLTTLAWQ